MVQKLKAPFPYFGGKSKVANIIWERFGNVKNYVEPFFGSGAVLLRRPHWKPGDRLIETVNDADGLLANFWRALAADPEGVAKHADWPVNEADLHARHIWLVNQKDSLTERLMGDHEWYDVKVAGFWVWGTCAWIGRGWCSGDGAWTTDGERIVRRDSLANSAPGITRCIPELHSSRGISRAVPFIAAGHGGRGVVRSIPHLSGASQGIHGLTEVSEILHSVAARMRRVRVTCGDWTRVMGASTLSDYSSFTGVFLDPPYGEGGIEYAAGGNANGDIAQEVWRWAVEHGGDPNLRICVAGYDDGREIPDGWRVVEWKATGGYGNQNKTGNTNRERERLWFSPHCIDPDEDSVLSLFGQREDS